MKIIFDFKDDFVHDRRCSYAQRQSNKCGCFHLAYFELINGRLKNLQSNIDRLFFLIASTYPRIEE